MDTLQAIRTIRSVRDFEARAVPEETITNILNAGRWSGSSKNTQPWQFILIRDHARLVELAACGDYAEHLTRANFAIATLTEATKRAAYDAGRCTQNMMLAAWNEGVGSCIASVHREADARRILSVPDEYTIQQVLSFGYPTDQYIHPPRKGGRAELADLLHQETWNKHA